MLSICLGRMRIGSNVCMYTRTSVSVFVFIRRIKTQINLNSDAGVNEQKKTRPTHATKQRRATNKPK